MPDGAGILMMVLKSLWVENFKNQRLWSVATDVQKLNNFNKNIKLPFNDDRINCQVM